jgi:hypothetical protein
MVRRAAVLLTTALWAALASVAHAVCEPNFLTALKELYVATNGPSWSPVASREGWMSITDPCSQNSAGVCAPPHAR